MKRGTVPLEAYLHIPIDLFQGLSQPRELWFTDLSCIYNYT